VLHREKSRTKSTKPAMGYTTAQASNLAGVVVIGSVLGAVVAAATTRLDRATNVIPLSIGVGFLMIGLVFIKSLAAAVPFLIIMGGICGYLIVPMNALLQHRGHNLMGAGRSIAVQNFNEQACILGLGAGYVFMTRIGLSAFGAIVVFGLLVAVIMELIRRWHASNAIKHRDEVERLLEIARSDTH
jgi:MFS transporter, LPLT family, lysophospholipid transporter